MAKFVGSDGSILDKLPPDLMMDPDAICSMDQDLASLASLPRNTAGGAASQATARAPSRSTTPTISTSTTAAAEAAEGCAIATTSKRNSNCSSSSNTSNNSSSSSITRGGAGALGGEHDVQQQQQQQHSPPEEDRSERAFTGESLLDDGDAPDDFLENLRELEWEAGAGAALDAAGGHDGDADADDEQGEGGGRSGGGGIEASGMKKRKKDLAKGVGEDASDADKQRASRDRNREHARNTRIRKKQYLESLKRGVGEMLQEKAREERDGRLQASKIAADRVAQRQMVLNMFYLKAAEELSPHAWACVLDDNFVCVSPIAPFCSFLPSEAREDHRLITGVDGMIQDTASFAVFIQSICPPKQNPTRRKLKYQFYTSPENTVVGPNELMCQWLMRTDNATECGAQCEVCSNGMLRARFSADNRIHRLDLIFDAMGLMQQLQRAMGGGVFRTIPNTLEAAMKPSQQAGLVCLVEPPYCIVHVNAAWTALMGHSLEDVKFFPSSLMNGPPEANNGGELDAFLHTCLGSSPKRAGMGDVRVITRGMRHLAVSIQAYPLGTPEGGMTHMLLIMEEVPVCAPLPLPQTASGLAGLELFPFV